MLTGRQVLVALERAANDPEAGQSGYWQREVSTFDVTADGVMSGTNVLGMVSHKTGALHRVAHWLLQAPFRAMGRSFGGFNRLLRLGHLVAERQGRAFTTDILRQVLSLALVDHNAPPAADGATVVIGDGYGALTALNLLAYPGRKVIAVNLTKSLLLDLTSAQRVVPEAGLALARDRQELDRALADPQIRLIGVPADAAAALDGAAFDLAFNVVSMQEMTASVVAEYFRLLRSSSTPRVTFYCANRLHKRLYDGTETRFDAYPWSPGDEVLVDAPCVWSQWVYSARPPFYYYRRDRIRWVWHRLARLAP